MAVSQHNRNSPMGNLSNHTVNPSNPMAVNPNNHTGNLNNPMVVNLSNHTGNLSNPMGNHLNSHTVSNPTGNSHMVSNLLMAVNPTAVSTNTPPDHRVNSPSSSRRRFNKSCPHSKAFGQTLLQP